MNFSSKLRIALILPLLALASGAHVSQAQTPSLPTVPRGNGVTTEQLQKLAWLRYMQGRSGGGGGGVKRGVPQFVPFGGGMPFGMMNQGGMAPVQGGAGGSTDPDADQGKKSVAEKKAEFEAAREAKKQKAKERAEKRKAELAERRAKAAPGK